jgi:hypothetical protein
MKGVIFDSLREAAHEGRAHVTHEARAHATGDAIMEEKKEDSFWASLPDFGHSLYSLLHSVLDHDGLHLDVDSYFG